MAVDWTTFLRGAGKWLSAQNAATNVVRMFQITGYPVLRVTHRDRKGAYTDSVILKIVVLPICLDMMSIQYLKLCRSL